MNINDYFQASVDAKDTAPGGGSDDLLRMADLPDGSQAVCVIEWAKGVTKDDGAPKFTCRLRVLDGPNEDGKFFENLSLSAKTGDGAKSYNKRIFAKLGAAGLGPQFFSSNPSNEAIAKALVDQKVLVTFGWQTPSEAQAKENEAKDRDPFSEHVWAPVSSAPAGGPAGFSGPQY